MKAIGLQPSSTGMVGGKETGQRMLDYVLPDGPFSTTFAALAASGWRLNLQSTPRPGAQGNPSTSKTKFSCPGCGQNAWGKPDLAIACIPCGRQMTPVPPPVAVRTYDREAEAPTRDFLDVVLTLR
jgi:hypothetical protein